MTRALTREQIGGYLERCRTHVQHHTAQLNLRLRERTGAAVDRVVTAGGPAIR